MKRKGVTLVELIIVIAIMGIVSGIANLFLTTEYKTYTATTKMLDTQERGRNILRIISDSIKNADKIKMVPTDISGYTFIITIKPYESDNSDKTYSYYIEDSSHGLYKYYNSNFTLISSKVKSVNIINIGADLYDINVVVYSDSTYDDTKTRTFATTAKYIKKRGSI